MGPENLDLLRSEVERVFGRKILNATDCQHLSNDIYQQTRLKISLNTLRRFFNLMKSKYNPSLFTVNLLLKYCSFSSFDELLSHKNHNGKSPVTSDANLLNFLVLIFRDFDSTGHEDLTYVNLVHEIINNLERWPQLIDKFQSQIAKTSNGQLFYFEQFVNVDKLNSYYGNGLRYYLHERKDKAAQIFGHSLLCFRDWLRMNKAGIDDHCHELSRYSVDETTSPPIAARYFAALLFQAETFDLNIESVAIAARDFYTSTGLAEKDHKGFPFFEFILSEALILTKQFEEALYYIPKANKRRNNILPAYIDTNLFESIYLFHAIALKNTGKMEKAKDMFKNVLIEDFYFLSKKLNLILYLSQKHQPEKKDLTDGQLGFLVKETGFIKLIDEFK